MSTQEERRTGNMCLEASQSKRVKIELTSEARKSAITAGSMSLPQLDSVITVVLLQMRAAIINFESC
jgi:hypothetical protein